MVSLRRALPAALLFTLVTSSAIAQTPGQLKATQDAQSDLEAFQRLLDQVDPPSLHAALHDFSPKKFTHGMFEKDRTAAEALHKEDASIASSIVALAKRQDNSTTTTSAAPVVPVDSSSTEVPNSASATTHVTPVGSVATATSTLPDGSLSTVTSVAPASSLTGPTSVLSTSTSPLVSEASTSNPVASSSGTGAATSEPETSALTAGQVATFTNAQGALTTGTFSSGQVITSVNAQGVTIVTTVGGGSRTLAPNGSTSGSNSASTTSTSARQSQTTTSRRTTTLPDGSRSTVTAVTIVPASSQDESVPSGTAGVGSASGTVGSSPGLQTGFAPKTIGFGREMLAVVGGAVGVAMMM
ncbi:MAG: hypothetical protein HETSPECPRED_000111 [Heterodermia speciosa]|uniref:Uncharacterized protein n=1 Tax=Heterodermia speciosa TaxID=116794 RepID=A0A8H3I796_9LECA|nr:MAG: hypothetical protein HETSPECPRED_000111 [Heterodermia speciosa]